MLRRQNGGEPPAIELEHAGKSSQRQLEFLGDERSDDENVALSDDFEAAIAEGATLVRIGSAIFGSRPSTPAG